MVDVARPSPSDSPNDPVTILVLDDEELTRVLVRRALTPAGWAVVEAGDGLEGLRILEAERPVVDAVLTDLEMPVISGYDVAAVLAQRLPELPVVVMSGRVTDDPRVGAARAVLHKPFAPEELCRTLAPVLEAARAMRTRARQQRAIAADARMLASQQRDLARAMQARSQGLVAAALALHRRPREP
jgi:two-component system C4-dicarboxylate transport response regulator DctD